MIAGAVYGVVLNDRDQVHALGGTLTQKPYGAAPVAPVLYIKPRNCLRLGGAAVPVPADMAEVEAAATLALLFGDEPGRPVAAALAIDVSEPHTSYYRPAIRQRCRDGFLPVGEFAAYEPALGHAEIVTRIDGEVAHRWSLSRLLRSPAALIADVAGFMTLANGDVLLVGLAGDAPRVRAGQTVTVETAGAPSLTAAFEPEPLG